MLVKGATAVNNTALTPGLWETDILMANINYVSSTYFGDKARTEINTWSSMRN